MNDWKEKLGQAHKLIEDIKALQANEDAGAEEKAKIPQMLEDFNALKAEAGQLKEIQMSALELEQEMKAASAPQEPEVKEREPGDGKPPVPPTGYDIKKREVRGSDFKDGGEFLHASWLASTGQKRDPRLVYFRDEEKSGHEQKQMVESVGASGGFLVPTEYLAQLQAVGPEDAIVRPRATKIRMRRRAIDIPVLDQTGTTSGRPHWFGGMIFYWAEEASAKTITTASFRKVTLTAHKLIGLMCSPCAGQPA